MLQALFGFHRAKPSAEATGASSLKLAPMPPAPLSPRERGEKDPRELLFYPLLSPGERRGRGGEGAAGATTLKLKATAGSDTTVRLSWHRACFSEPRSVVRVGEPRAKARREDRGWTS